MAIQRLMKLSVSNPYVKAAMLALLVSAVAVPSALALYWKSQYESTRSKLTEQENANNVLTNANLNCKSQAQTCQDVASMDRQACAKALEDAKASCRREVDRDRDINIIFDAVDAVSPTPCSAQTSPAVMVEESDVGMTITLRSISGEPDVAITPEEARMIQAFRQCMVPQTLVRMHTERLR